MISASSRARVLNGDTTMWATRLKNSIIRISLAALAAHASADGVFSKNNNQKPTRCHLTTVNCWRNGSDANAPTKSRRLLCIARILKRARGRPSLSARQWTPDPLESESARLLYDLKEETPNETAGNSSSERVPGRRGRGRVR